MTPPRRLLIRSRLHEPIVTELGQHWQITCLPRTPDRWVLTPAQLVAALAGVDVLVTESDPVTADVLAACPALQAVVVCRGTPVTVDVAAASREGILIVNSPGRNAIAVAELCVALVLMTARHLAPALEAVRTGRWATAPTGWAYQVLQGTEICGKTVGLIGLGAVGREVAVRLRGLRMEVLAFDPYVPADVAATAGATLVPLLELLARADFLSVHIHVSQETKGMLGAREFAQMKPTAILINTARAGAVDEAALLEALGSGRIAGAGLDVYHVEPLAADHPLLHLPNVVLLPHIGGATSDVIQHQWEIAAANLGALRQGRTPPNLYNADVLRSPRLRFGRPTGSSAVD